MAVDYKELKKGGFMRQKQKDCFSMRLKSVGGHFTAAQLATVQKVAEQYGKNYVHLTSRQGIEHPLHPPGRHRRSKKVLHEGGVEVGVCGPRVRTITACQGAATCFGPHRHRETRERIRQTLRRQRTAAQVQIRLHGLPQQLPQSRRERFWRQGRCTAALGSARVHLLRRLRGRLPQKIVKVDKAAQQVTFDREQCVYCGKCIKSCPTDAWQGDHGFVISFGGLYGNRIAVGRPFPAHRFRRGKTLRDRRCDAEILRGERETQRAFRQLP